jgi:serine protease AprX
VHPDLADARVLTSIDFVKNGNSQRSDFHGHGTHVAGVVGGTGAIDPKYAGIAPGTNLVSLRVLDDSGKGSIGDIISALEWIAKNYIQYNIRVVNMSVGAGVYESYWTDPLTLAAKALVEHGIIVVGAAGNLGSDAEGNLQYGGVTAPGNAPWVLTVGASSTEGTVGRDDDVLASYSSNGPTFIDFTAKPDLVAPGTGTVSLAAPGSAFYALRPEYLVDGQPQRGAKPYLVLSGTSMAAPVVSGTLAMMLEANPTLTPNLAKAILQYTAERDPDYHPLRQGAGFLNALGAVALSEFFARNAVGEAMPLQTTWGRQIIWGNYQVSDGYLNPRGNAWDTRVVWGATRAFTGHDSIVWGTACGNRCGNIVWSDDDASGANLVTGTGRFENIVWGTGRFDNIVWGTGRLDNIVWGTGRFDNIVWGTGRFDNIVWGTGRFENIVWGTGRFDNIVWGTGRFDNIVWGTGRFDNIVWGTGRFDNIVWGTDCGGTDCDHVVWGEPDQDGVVWGTAKRFDNIVWGTGRFDNIVWGTGRFDNIVWGTSFDGDVAQR